MLLRELFLFETPELYKTFATNRFVKDFEGFLSASNDKETLRQLLIDFVRFRKTHSSPRSFEDSFGRKDSFYNTTSLLSGFAHCHLIFGKVIVSYGYKSHKKEDGPGEVVLLRVHDHREEDEARSLAITLKNGMKTFSFPFNEGDVPRGANAAPQQEEPVDVHLKAEIENAVHEIVFNPKEVQMALDAVNGEDLHFIDTITWTVEGDLTLNERREIVYKCFRGKDNFFKFVTNALKQTPHGSKIVNK